MTYFFKENKFSQDNPISFRLALYQDGVEIVNAIGPAKSKHKLLAVYLSILNIPDHFRSRINSIKLVALCKEKDFDHQAIYGRIVADLKKLETVGIRVPGEGNVKAGLVFIARDNLGGSHGLGGFVENFSKSVYFCRYCIVDRPSFRRAGGECRVFPFRTPAMYNDAVEKGTGKKSGHHGVKFNSLFNSLESFHCCRGLPRCYGHDLMEGCCAYDLKLFIDHFIAEGWFTLHELNEAIASFPYSSQDIKDKPIPVQQDSKRIKGGAWQVWTFQRLLPLMILDYVTDRSDKYWTALLVLLEIVEIVCAPPIHKSHLPYLQNNIEEYLTLRRQLFPDVPLRPKHQYLSNYPELILMFGPLIRCWTMRFESKHTFVKRIARNIRNFKNILFSFSLKHELLQCYLRTGADSVLPVELFKPSEFISQHYSPAIINAVTNTMNSLSQVQICDFAKLKGTAYANGNIVVLSQESYQCDVSLGRIILILYDCMNSVFFVCEKLESLFDISTRLYRVGHVQGYVCVTPESLLSYHPHHTYEISSEQYVKLQHSIVSTPE